LPSSFFIAPNALHQIPNLKLASTEGRRSKPSNLRAGLWSRASAQYLKIISEKILGPTIKLPLAHNLASLEALKGVTINDHLITLLPLLHTPPPSIILTSVFKRMRDHNSVQSSLIPLHYYCQGLVCYLMPPSSPGSPLAPRLTRV
jgi:hypothetical protein